MARATICHSSGGAGGESVRLASLLASTYGAPGAPGSTFNYVRETDSTILQTIQLTPISTKRRLVYNHQPRHTKVHTWTKSAECPTQCRPMIQKPCCTPCVFPQQQPACTIPKQCAIRVPCQVPNQVCELITPPATICATSCQPQYPRQQRCPETEIIITTVPTNRLTLRAVPCQSRCNFPPPCPPPPPAVCPPPCPPPPPAVCPKPCPPPCPPPPPAVCPKPCPPPCPPPPPAVCPKPCPPPCPPPPPAVCPPPCPPPPPAVCPPPCPPTPCAQECSADAAIAKANYAEWLAASNKAKIAQMESQIKSVKCIAESAANRSQSFDSEMKRIIKNAQSSCDAATQAAHNCESTARHADASCKEASAISRAAFDLAKEVNDKVNCLPGNPSDIVNRVDIIDKRINEYQQKINHVNAEANMALNLGQDNVKAIRELRKDHTSFVNEIESKITNLLRDMISIEKEAAAAKKIAIEAAEKTGWNSDSIAKLEIELTNIPRFTSDIRAELQSMVEKIARLQQEGAENSRRVSDALATAVDAEKKISGMAQYLKNIDIRSFESQREVETMHKEFGQWKHQLKELMLCINNALAGNLPK